MSKYTTEVRYICEQCIGLTESTGGTSVKNVISQSAPIIFADSLSSIPTAHRTTLPEKILMHYYTREIGFETAGLWRLKLNMKMNEIMPYYSSLYASAELITEPLVDVDYSRTIYGEDDVTKELEDSTATSGNKSGDSSSTSNSVNKNVDRYSDTPQGALTNIENNKYLTNARILDRTDTDSNSGEFSENYSDNKSTNASENNERDYHSTETVKGKSSNGISKSKLLEEYRKTIINIDMMIINDLADLFMLVY